MIIQHKMFAFMLLSIGSAGLTRTTVHTETGDLAVLHILINTTMPTVCTWDQVRYELDWYGTRCFRKPSEDKTIKLIH